MSAQYVRDYYGVPAKSGMWVRVDGRLGWISSFQGQYLMVRFEGARHSVPCHPTWRVEYDVAGRSS